MDTKKICDELRKSLEKIFRNESSYLKSKDEIENIILGEFHITDINEFFKTINNEDDRKYFEDFFDKFELTIEAYLSSFEIIKQIEKTPDQYASDILDKFKNKEIEEFDEYFIYLIVEKLNVDKTLIDNFLDLRETFIEKKYEEIEDVLSHSIVGKLNNQLLNDLVNNSPDIVDDLLYIYKSSRKSNYSVKDLTIETINNALSKNIRNIIYCIPDEMLVNLDDEFIFKLLKKCDFSLLSKEKQKIITSKFTFKTLCLNNSINNAWIFYSMYDEIDSESFDYILENKYYSSIENNKYIMNNKEYIKKIIDNGFIKILFYLDEDGLDDELFDYAKTKCSDFGKEFIYRSSFTKYSAFNSKKNLLKIANYIYTYFDNFLEYVPDEHLNETILFCALNGMKEPSNEKYKKYYKKDLESIKYALELGYIYTDRTNITNEDEVKLFIDKGYGQSLDKLFDQRKKVSFDLYKSAIENGYKYNGLYNIASVLNCKEDLIQLLSYLIENNRQDFIVQNMSYHGTISYNNQLCSNFEYICNCLYDIAGDNDFKEFLEKIGMFDSVLDVLIYKYHTTNLCVKYDTPSTNNKYYNFEEIIKERYENYESIMQYLTYINKVPEFTVNKEDIDKYFDKNGPTKLYYSKTMFSQYSLYSKVFLKDDYYKQLYSDEPYILSFINFRAGLNNKFDWHKLQNDLPKYFDENGTKQEMFDLALFDAELIEIYKYLYDIEEIYPSRPEIKQYYVFRKKYDYFDFSDINIDNVNEYFDNEGATKKLYDRVLFNKDWFSTIFNNNDSYITRYSSNPEVLQYIKLRLSNPSINYNFINNYDDLNKYFDETGPTKDLFVYALFNDPWFKALMPYKDKFLELLKNDPELLVFAKFKFDNPSISFITSEELLKNYFDESGPKDEYYKYAFESNDNKYFNSIYNEKYILLKYKDNPSILAYSKFINVYGNIFCDFIKYEDITKYFDENGYTNELVNYFNQNKDKAKKILSNLAHNDKVLNNLDRNFIDIFKEYIVSTFLKDVENPYDKYEYFVNNIGPKLLFNLENEKVKKLLNYNKEQLDSLFNLFDKENTEIPNERVYSSFVHSLLTFKFRKEYPDIVDVFTNMNSLIIHMSEEELVNLLKNYNSDNSTELGKWITRISEALNIDEAGLEEFKNAIMECRSTKEQPLRDICRCYLEKCQREYAEQNKDDILLELDLPITYDKQDANTKLYNYFLQNVDYENFKKMIEQLKNSFDYENSSGFIEQISMDKSDFDLVLNLTKEQFDLISSAIRNKTKPDDTVKKEFSLLKRTVSQYSKYIVSNNLTDKELLNKLNVKKSVKIPLEELDTIQIINELDMDLFLNSVASNEKIYANLQKLFSKYYIGRLPSNMGKKIEIKYNKTLPGGINNIGIFITKYYQFLLNKQKKLKNDNKKVDLEDIMFNFMEVIDSISISNSETYELKRLIGTEEYLDFVSNRPNNPGHGSRTEREEKMGLIVDYLYSVDSVTIPSGDIIVEAGDKKINFIVGNRTNPANICHGERTGACMRVGGIGEGLFLKCLTDKNWFHIRIEDPDTHEYVSRVSGFRNGNTLYLNQLRNVPSGCKYTNEDLQKFIETYAKELVEQTKDSKFPIENVFINGGTAICYAMVGYAPKNGKTYHLGIDIQKEYNLEGLHHLKIRTDKNDIWTDIKNNAVLLATTEEGAQTEEGYAPLKNGPENTEIYPATRDKIYGLEYVESDLPKHCFVTVSNSELFEKINRVHCMKAKLLGSDYRYNISDVLDLSDDYYMVDGYASSDWYVYIDNNKVIHSDYISEIKKNDEIISYTQSSNAQAEMEYYKQILERKYNLDAEVKYAV